MLSIRFCKYKVPFSGYNLQRLLLYTTNSSDQIPNFPNQSYTNYLIDHLGFSPQQAHSISAKLPYKFADAHFSKFSGNANSVIHFFKQQGFDDIHIKKVVSFYPQFLSANVDLTLQPKLKLLQDHGFSESSLLSLILANPSILVRRLDPIIIRDLRAILGTTDNIIRFFNRTPTNLFMGPSALEKLNSNIALLNKEYGVDINLIRTAILLHPTSYMNNTDVFQNTVARVEKELGIPRNSRMFTYGIYLLCSSSKESIDSKCEVFKTFGWTEYDVSESMRRNPQIFQLSEENISKKLGFLMTKLGYKPNFLATKAALFTLSLEKRLAPRHRVLVVLKEKGLLNSYNFYSAACKSEKQFLKIFIEPFKEDAQGLLEFYENSKGDSNLSEHQQCQALY